MVVCTLKPLYKTVCYVSDIRWFKGGPQYGCIHVKMYRIYRKVNIYGHFFYIIYSFLYNLSKMCR